jgi:hypothetical protein
VTLKPAGRKLALTAHVVSSVGWLGAVVTFLALALAGVTSEDADTVRSAYLAMEAIGWFVLVPLSLASLLTGLVQSLGSAWGLFRHYWVVFKLLINVAATVVLVLYMQTLDHFARVAAVASASPDVPDALRSPSPLIHSALALLLLLVATVLAIYKPRGVTPWGQRRLAQQRGR